MTHHATDESTAFVLGCVISGMPHALIARTLGISDPTLRAHYAEYLEWGKEIALAKVARTAYEMAASGKDTAMTIFYLKTQGKWRETTHVELDVNIRERAVEIAKGLGMSELDAEETVAEIEKRLKAGAM